MRAANLTWDGGDATANGSYGGTGTWDANTTANWTNAGSEVNWTDTSANGTDTAVFAGTAGTVALNANLSALGLQFATPDYTILGTGTLTLGTGGINGSALTSGTVTVGNALALAGNQSWNSGSGATLSVLGGINAASSGVKVLTVSGAGNTTINGPISSGAGSINLVNSGAGTLTLSYGGTSTIASNLNMTGGLVQITAGTINVTEDSGNNTGLRGGANMTVSGGNLNIAGSAGWFPIGDTGGQISTLTVSGGIVTVANGYGTEVGRLGSGVLTITSGTFRNADTSNSGLIVGDAPTGYTVGSTATVNLNGGALQVNKIVANRTGGLLYFNGGTLSPTATNASFFNSTANITAQVRNGGAMIDTAGYDATIAQALVHSSVGGDNAIDGGLTKNGVGTLTLTGANTYTGSTNVYVGRLVVSGAGTLANTAGLSVGAGATFSYQPTTIGATLTLGAGSTLGLSGGSAVSLAWNTTAANMIKVLGAATVDATTGVGLDMGAGTFTSGTPYTILQAGSGLDTGSYYFLNNTNYTGTVTTSATSVSVTPTTATALTNAYWVGTNAAGISGKWAVSDGSSTSNWASTAGGAVQALIPGSGATVTISGSSPVVAPTSTTLGANMSIAGLVIADTTNGLTLNADNNTLTIGTGGITVNAGVPASTIGANVVIGGNQTWTNNSANTLTVSGGLSNTATLTKAGTGAVTLSGNNSNTGAITVSAGTLNYSGTNLTSGAINVGVSGVTGAATLNIQSGANITANPASILVGNGTVSGVGEGYVYQSGGTVSMGNTASHYSNLQLGAGASGNSYGYYNLSGGSLTVSEADIGSFNGISIGVLDVSGGTVNIGFANSADGWFIADRTTGSGGLGIVNLTSGTINYTGPANHFQCNWGSNGTAIFNIAGTFTAPLADVNLNQKNNASNFGEINLLAGGTMQVHSINPNNSGTRLVNFNGGTLKANTANTTFLNNLSAVNVYGNGGTIDNNGVAITVPVALLAASGSGVSTVAITNAGSGYLGAPAVNFSGGGGTGAAGYAVISSGTISGIVITNPGTGYTSAPTITLTGGGGSGATFGTINLAANTSGGMIFSGAGTTTLSGANTYSGQTVIASGTLALGNASALQNSTLNYNNQGGALSFGSITSATLGGLSGAQNLALANSASAAVALSVGNNGANTTYSGTLSGIGSVTKIGNGTLTLTGANTYSGGTTISNGTLQLGDGASLNGSVTGNITNNGALVFNNPNSLSYAGSILGSGSVSKIGAGTLTLTGMSSYTGATTIATGTLQFGDGSTANGGVSGNIVNSGALVFANPRAQTYFGTISGTGGLSKSGNGTLTLSGNNTYTGNTTVNAGTLAFSGIQSVTGNISTADGANLSVVVGSAGATTLAPANLTLGNSGANSSLFTIDFNNLTNPTTAPVSVSGALTLNGNVSLGVTNPGNLTNGSFNLFNAGTISGTFANSTVQFGARSTGNLGYTSTAVTMDVSTDSITWSGANGGIWTTTAINDNSNGNWATVSGKTTTSFWANDIVKFGDTYDTTNSGGGLNSLTSPQTVTVSGSISPASVAFNNSAVDYTIVGSGTITGSTTLTKNGTGALTLTTANDYTGGTILNSGTLNINHAAAIGTGALTINGGTIDNTSGSPITLSANNAQNWNGSFGFTGTGDLNLGTGSVTLGANSTAAVNGGTLTVGGAIGGGFGLTKSGSGTLVLTGASTYSGGLTLNSGTLNITQASAIGTGSLTINGGTLDNTGGAAMTFSANNAQNWNGDFIFNGTNDLNMGTGSVTLGASPTVAVNGGTLTVGGAINGSFGLTKSGTGTLVLTGANTYSGGTGINGGLVKVGNATALGASSGAVSVNSGAALDLNGTTMTNQNALTLNGSGISNGGALTNSSATAVTYAGLVSLGSDSTIVANSGNIILSNAGTITGSGFNLTLDGSATGNSIASIIGTGAGSLTKNGTGTWALNGANTYSGGTTLNAGTLQLGSGDALGTGTLTSNGGTLKWSYVSGNANINNSLVVNGATSLDLSVGNMTLNGNISGSGALNRLTAASLSLNLGGDNSGYTGTFTNLNPGTNSVAALNFTSASAGSASANWVFNNVNVGKTSLTFASGTISFGSMTGNGAMSSTAGTKTISVGALGNANDIYSGAIVNGLGTVALTKVGPGTMTMTGTSSYSGGTTVNGGTLNINGDNTSAGNVTVNSGATLGIGGTYTGGGSFTVNGTATINGSKTGTGAVTVASGATLNGAGSVSGAVTVAGSLEGSLTLNNDLTIDSGASAGAASFNGNVVNNGTLTSDIIVAAGKTLSGSGTCNGAVTATTAGSVIAPGNGGVGNLSMNDLSIATGAHLSMNILGTTAGGYSTLTAANTLNLSGGDLTLNIGSFTPGTEDIYLIVNSLGGAGTNFGTYGAFDSITFAGAGTGSLLSGTGAEGTELMINGATYMLTYQADYEGSALTGGNDIALLAVPEPTTWTMIVSGLGMLVFFQRNRRRK